MTRQEALKFWEWRYENAKDYYDDHWEADERKSHREYVQALEWAVKALADRKTENSSEKPNNCETCANGEGDIEACGYCRHGDLYEPKTEPTISKMEQVETMSCQECKHFHENAVMYLDQCDFCFKDCKYEPKDEPTISKMEQVDKDINVRSKDEPTTQTETQNSNLTFEKADEPQSDDVFDYCPRCGMRILSKWYKDEPQTDCAWR